MRYLQSRCKEMCLKWSPEIPDKDSFEYLLVKVARLVEVTMLHKHSILCHQPQQIFSFSQVPYMKPYCRISNSQGKTEEIDGSIVVVL